MDFQAKKRHNTRGKHHRRAVFYLQRAQFFFRKISTLTPESSESRFPPFVKTTTAGAIRGSRASRKVCIFILLSLLIELVRQRLGGQRNLRHASDCHLHFPKFPGPRVWGNLDGKGVSTPVDESQIRRVPLPDSLASRTFADRVNWATQASRTGGEKLVITESMVLFCHFAFHDHILQSFIFLPERT
jgi:hypothetical protein